MSERHSRKIKREEGARLVFINTNKRNNNNSQTTANHETQQQEVSSSSETDPLLPPPSRTVSGGVVVGEGLSRSSRENTESHHGGTLRSRRSSRSPSIPNDSTTNNDPPLLLLLEPTTTTTTLQQQQQSSLSATQQQQLPPQLASNSDPMDNTSQGLDHYHQQQQYHHHLQQQQQHQIHDHHDTPSDYYQPRELPGGSVDRTDRTYQSTDSTSHTSYSPESPLSSLDDDASSSYSGETRQQQRQRKLQRHVVIPISRTPSVQRSSVGRSPSQQQSLQQQLAQSPHNHRNLPLLEIPEEIYIVRTSALQVLKPLTASWLVVTVGFSLTVLFAMSRWTRLLPSLPFWFILLPAWLSHVSLFYCHLRSASALSNFITQANENRQRPDSRDHLDRTEYLPLLQRSLKFGLKTGVLSFFIFIFEILMYIRIANANTQQQHNVISLTAVLSPIWILVTAGILDGIICRTQHMVRLLCWLLVFAGMVLSVLKVDYGYDHIRWRIVVSPFVSVLSLTSAMLIYIIYGHQVGYYRLTESQLTAGNLYSLAALICIVLVVVIGEIIPLSRPIEIGTKLALVVLAPLAVVLVGMGAWVISQDEFGRLLLYGGQAAVHPMKLRWETNGWTCVQSRGITIIPMFGEVSFRPLEKSKNTTSSSGVIELCRCCSCYPYEDDDEETLQYMESLGNHSYHIAAAASNRSSGGGGAAGGVYNAPSGL